MKKDYKTNEKLSDVVVQKCLTKLLSREKWEYFLKNIDGGLSHYNQLKQQTPRAVLKHDSNIGFSLRFSNLLILCKSPVCERRSLIIICFASVCQKNLVV